jgi:hypothetical protein
VKNDIAIGMSDRTGGVFEFEPADDTAAAWRQSMDVVPVPDSHQTPDFLL